MITVPEFEDKGELFDFLRKNKAALYAEKRSTIKLADAVSHVCPVYDSREKVFKEEVVADDLLKKDSITARLAINTTNLLDSHKDVHIPGLWKKSLKENGRRLLHLKEHKMSFDSIIADAMDGELKALTEFMKWSDLGVDFKGETEVLLFESQIKKARNEFMFEQYAKSYVKSHSVGMGYVVGKYLLAVNSEEKYWREEKDNWDKYIEEIANKEAAEETGYFWAVLEARAIEGSAVPRGSNFVTPTIDLKSEPGNHSQKNEPEKSTQKKIDYSFLIKNL